MERTSIRRFAKLESCFPASSNCRSRAPAKAPRTLWLRVPFPPPKIMLSPSRRKSLHILGWYSCSCQNATGVLGVRIGDWFLVLRRIAPSIWAWGKSAHAVRAPPPLRALLPRWALAAFNADFEELLERFRRTEQAKAKATAKAQPKPKVQSLPRCFALVRTHVHGIQGWHR